MPAEDWFMPICRGDRYIWSFFFILLMLIFKCSSFIFIGNCIFIGRRNKQKVNVGTKKAAHVKQRKTHIFRLSILNMIRYHEKHNLGGGVVLSFPFNKRKQSFTELEIFLIINSFWTMFLNLSLATFNNQKTSNKRLHNIKSQRTLDTCQYGNFWSTMILSRPAFSQAENLYQAFFQWQ